MKLHSSLTILLATLSSSSILASTTSPSNAQLSQEIQQIDQQTKKLQNEVKSLRTKLHQEELQKKTQQKKAPIVITKAPTDAVKDKDVPLADQYKYSTGYDVYGHAPTVTTSPLVGLYSAYNAQDLLEQSSSMNEDLTLLKQHQQYYRFLASHGETLTRPVLVMSGGVEGQLYDINGYNATSKDRGISLSTAEIDMDALASTWASAFLSLDYDNSPVSTGSRDPRSTVYLKRGFLTLGNLEQFPMYFTLGETYVPYGKYSSIMLSTPLTQSLARIRSAAAILGLVEGGFYGQAYGYAGDEITANNSVIEQGGVNTGYTYSFGESNSIDFGLGWVSNLADSQGMQNTGNSNSNQFQGFAFQNANNLRHAVPAADAHTTWNLGPISLIGEFVSAVDSFNVNDLMFNNEGALPQAMHSEIDYGVNFWNRPFTFGLIYGQTWDSLAVNLPRYSYAAVMTVSIWKSTIEGLEYRHDINYSNGNVADGGPSPHVGNQITGGGTRNSVLAQFGVYF